MRKYLLILGVISLLLTVLFTPHLITIQAKGTNISWECTLNYNESGGKTDSVVFGEVPDAHDGPPADSHDVVKPPAPISPYIRAWFNDNLPVPYNLLWMDYRHYPGITKVWNLSVQWVPSDYYTPTTVTLSWDPVIVNNSEYTSVILCTHSGTPLKNMLLYNNYTFTCPANIPQSFKIICSRTNNPPTQPHNPSPADGVGSVPTNSVLSWSGGDPNGDVTTYDVFFGAATPPPKIVSKQSATSFTPGALATQTTYYWRIVSWDPFGANTTGPIWTFITSTTSSPPGDNGTNESNKPPVANITISDWIGRVNTLFIFDGSHSHDPDGYLTTWSWDFGDGTTISGETASHAYQAKGTYTIRLTVTDNQGATDTDTVTVQITATNYPPTQPVINGTTRGTKNKTYAFTVSSTDADNDSIQYNITWGDGTENTSVLLPNGTIASFSHSWASAGKYHIAVTASDTTAISKDTTFTVFIDVHFVGTLGFLLDMTGDGIYDSFVANATGTPIVVQRLANGSYLLDINNNGKVTYLYNPTTGSLSLMATTSNTNTLNTSLILGMIISIILIISIAFFLERRR